MRYLLLFCCAGLAFGQGTETKGKVEDYDLHADAKVGAIGAEYMVHSYSSGEQMFIAKDYLVVEAAIFPKGSSFELRHTDFSLRINGRKELLEAQSTVLVMENMRHPEMSPERDGLHPQVTAASTNGGITLGGPPVNPNPFPGSKPPGPPYPPVEVPRDNPTGVTKEPVDPYEVLQRTALPEGQHHAAVSGFLFFPFRGKTASIKSLDLIYGDTVLKLR